MRLLPIEIHRDELQDGDDGWPGRGPEVAAFIAAAGPGVIRRRAAPRHQVDDLVDGPDRRDLPGDRVGGGADHRPALVDGRRTA